MKIIYYFIRILEKYLLNHQLLDRINIAVGNIKYEWQAITTSINHKKCC